MSVNFSDFVEDASYTYVKSFSFGSISVSTINRHAAKSVFKLNCILYYVY